MKIQKIKYQTPEYRMSVDLRDEMLRKPLGLTFSEEFLKQDENDKHFGIFEEDYLIATLTFQILDSETIKMRQVAVRTGFQGTGFGDLLVKYSERYAINHGYKKITLHARKLVSRFYEKLGYSIVGQEFEEVGIAHVEMEKMLE